MKLWFSGSSDDVFGYECETTRGDTHSDCGVGSLIRWRITHRVKGELRGLTVVGVYGVAGPTWTIGIGGLDDDDDGLIETWPARFITPDFHYSPKLEIVAPEGASIERVERSAGRRGLIPQ